MALRNCPSCARPVRKTEAACPFCSALLNTEGGTFAKVARATIGGVVVLAAGTGCTLEVAAPQVKPTASPRASAKPSPSPSTPVAQPVYGAPAQPMPAYGMPASPLPTPTATPDNSSAPVYGAPAPPSPVYGAPAPPRQ